MASPTSPTAYAPESREFCFAVESVAAGTAGTAIIHEVAEDVTITPNRGVYTSTGFRKASATRGKSYVTQRYVDISIRVCWHSGGFGAFALGLLQGNASEGAVTGTTPKIHTWTPSATTNRMNTVTIWMDYGDHSHVQKCVRGTISGWSTTVSPDSVVECTITLTANWPTYTTTVTPTNWVGSTANYPITPILGTQGTYTLFNGAGSAITTNILDCSLNLSRNVAPLPNAQSVDPADINANEMMFSGSLHWEYDGLGSNTVQDDFMTYANLGNSGGALQKFIFTNADSHGFEIDAYYLRWSNFQPDFSGAVTTAMLDFIAEHDEAQLDQASPVLTAPKTVIVNNALTAAMTT